MSEPAKNFLLTQIKQKEDEYPESIHKMPIHRGSFRYGQQAPWFYRSNRNVEQPDYSAEQVQAMGGGKYIEETTAGI